MGWVKYILTFILLMLMGMFTAFAQEEGLAVKWLDWEEAIEKVENEDTPKKIFVDVYTDWCGWCKKMDKNTFANPEVAAYMRNKFYMVKLDGEGKEAIEYNGRTFKYVPSGKRGYHELAAALLQNRFSYPTGVFLNEKQQLLSPVPGYQGPDKFLKVARYFGDNIYETTSWEEYSDGSR
ncbi:thioredoxin family protein [Sinomicrobium kalidii]|uniref:thioredoxin family protein n=1 Tax=Sinomicrobium kalidii TaxID=2900738 RepID=UPI003F5D52A7